VLWVVFILASATITHTIKTLKLSEWYFGFPYFIWIIYFSEKISQFGPEKWKLNIFHEVSSMQIRARMIFWISTISISILSILEGFFLPSVNLYIGFLFMILNFLVWIGVNWISLRNEFANEKNKQGADQNK
jgi:hypothetical protein